MAGGVQDTVALEQNGLMMPGAADRVDHGHVPDGEPVAPGPRSDQRGAGDAGEEGSSLHEPSLLPCPARNTGAGTRAGVDLSLRFECGPGGKIFVW